MMPGPRAAWCKRPRYEDNSRGSYGDIRKTTLAESLAALLTRIALAAMHTAAVRDRLTELGAEFTPDNQATPQYLGDFVKAEIAKWAVPIRASGVSVD